MAGILSTLGRGNQKKDPMRESAALTTVYLLEQNQKFERFMQQKVDDLESRVAAQQARLSTREEVEERELWATLEVGDGIDGVATERGPADEPEFEAEDILPEWNEAPPTPPDDEESLAHVTAAEPEAVPDYLALMGGSATEPDDHAVMTNDKEGDGLIGDPAPVPYLEMEGETMPLAPASSTTELEVPVALPEEIPVSTANDEVSPTRYTEVDPAELLAAEIEPDSWPDQYEAFQVAWPDGDEVDELWPDVDVVGGVDLLAGQTAIEIDKPPQADPELPDEPVIGPGDPAGSQQADSGVTDPGETEVELEPAGQEAVAEPGLATSAIGEVEAQTTTDLKVQIATPPETSIAAETLDQVDDDEAEPWESTLPAGQKDEWS